MSKNDKFVSEELNNLKTPLNNNQTSTDNDLLLFFIGVILLGAGLFMLSKRVMVHSSWNILRVGGFNLSSGTITIPLIIGIIWYFVNPKSIIPKIIITLGVIFIVITIIMSVRINFITTSMFDYILIFGMTGAGAGCKLEIPKTFDRFEPKNNLNNYGYFNNFSFNRFGTETLGFKMVEETIEPNQNLYVLGEAFKVGNVIHIGKPMDGKKPFIVTTKSEEDLVNKSTQQSLFLLLGGIAAILIGFIFLFKII